LAARQIEGVSFVGTLDQMRAQLGSDSIEIIPRDIDSDQGVRVIDTLWVVSMSGHTYTLWPQSRQILISDSVFKTLEGVGIGSTVQEFERHYGVPTFQGEDIGCTLEYSIFGLKVLVYVDGECGCGRSYDDLDRTCTIANMWIVVPA
jgi:hypothetical protein